MSNCAFWWVPVIVALAFVAGYFLASLMWATRREAEEEIFGDEYDVVSHRYWKEMPEHWAQYDKPTVIRLKEKRDD